MIIGSGIGGLPLIERCTKETLAERGPDRVGPFFIPGLIVNMAAGQVSIQLRRQGAEHGCPCTACTTGLHAVGDAFRLIQHGYADAMIAGGTEAAITPLAFAGFCVDARAVAPQRRARARFAAVGPRPRRLRACREGAGILVLEELEAAQRARRARSTPRSWATA